MKKIFYTPGKTSTQGPRLQLGWIIIAAAGSPSTNRPQIVTQKIKNKHLDYSGELMLISETKILSALLLWRNVGYNIKLILQRFFSEQL